MDIVYKIETLLIEYMDIFFYLVKPYLLEIGVFSVFATIIAGFLGYKK